MQRLVLIVACMCVAASASGSPDHSVPRAEALVKSAERHLRIGTIDSRRVALGELEQATLIDRENPEYELLLARAYYQCGFLSRARARFQRVAALEPEDADARFGLGQVWRRDWLKYLESSSLDRAIDHFSAAGRLAPARVDPWIQLVPLLIERNDLAEATAAAGHAREAEPNRPEALLAVATTAYRTGDVARADSLFHLAVPRLPRLAKQRFEDISPVATERDTFALHRLSPTDQVEFVSRFWRENDPDLASPENEAKLEYWSRVAQAFLLFFDTRRRQWDERGEVYVRYGRPARITYNPLPELVERVQHNQRQARDLVRRGNLSYVVFGTGPMYPVNAQLWEYPELGMSVVLQDRLLSEFYLFPMQMEHDPDPAPDPDSLEARDDHQLAVRGGRGVFAKLPPGVKPMPVHGRVARFMTDDGPRLLGDVESPGMPDDSLWADWVVLDSSRAEVARGSRALSASACDPTDRRVAQFAASIPSGEYLVGMTVRDRAGRRGVFRTESSVEGPGSRLGLSDVVVSCGIPEAAAMTRDVRVEPNPEARVSQGDPLTAYFEIYHLTPGGDGQSRFQYVYSVKSAEKDKRVWIQRLFAPRSRIPEISASRETENVGSLRRQFVTVPVQSLPAGKYLLEITVKDLVAGNEARASAPFVKEPAALRN